MVYFNRFYIITNMPGGLMQLISYGSENTYLTGNPQITFFKTVYRRHTNFAMEYIEQYFTTLPNFSANSETIATVKIERNADLMYDCYLLYDLPAIYSTSLFSFRWVNNVGLRVINYVEIFVNGQVLDKQYGMWMYIWNEISLPLSKRDAYNKLVGNTSELTSPKNYHGFYQDTNSVPSIPTSRLYIPLEFWFCKNPGLAIPLIALQYTEITINVHFNPLNDLFLIKHLDIEYSPNEPLVLVNFIQNHIYSTPAQQTEAEAFIPIVQNSSSLIWYYINGTLTPGNWLENTDILVNYIYLDNDERRKFASISHEYLITQLFRVTEGNLNGNGNVIEFKLQHPVKDIIWVYQRDDADTKNDWNNFTNQIINYKYSTVDNDNYTDSQIAEFKKLSEVSNINPFYNGLFNNYIDIMYSSRFIFNGKDRFSERDFNFFNALIPYKYDTNSPVNGIYSYPFALYPEKNQPSGDCNFSRVNKFQINMALRYSKDINTKKVINYNMFLFSVNYNVFTIIGGIGGVKFA